MSTPEGRLSAALVDRYRIERELGAGGMATVYLAQDLRHDRRVALKILRPKPASAIVAATRTPGPGFSVAGRRTVVDGGVTDLNGSNVNWDVQPDGKGFLYIEGGGGVSLQVTWIRNWVELVKSKAGTKAP